MSARKRERIAQSDPSQMMISGVKPVSLGERVSWAAQQPMQPKATQRPLDIGFWNPMRDQLEMF